MKKFDFNKVNNSLNEAFDFDNEIENLDTSSIFNIFGPNYYKYMLYNLLYDKMIEELLKDYNYKNFEDFLNYVKSVLSDPNTVEKAFIEFSNVFGGCCYDLFEEIECVTCNSDEYLAYFDIGSFLSCLDKVKPTPETCSLEALLIGVALDYDAELYYLLEIYFSYTWDDKYDDGPYMDKVTLYYVGIHDNENNEDICGVDSKNAHYKEMSSKYDYFIDDIISKKDIPLPEPYEPSWEDFYDD